MILQRFYIPSFLLLLLAGHYVAGLDRWMQPNNRLRYDETCYLTSHNAFASSNQGWHHYMMQTWNIKEQLDQGIRGLMLDIYEYGDTIMLCHIGCGAVHSLQKGISTAVGTLLTGSEHYETLQQALIIIKDWVDAHPSEVVTLFIESHVTPEKLNGALMSVKGFAPLVVSPRDWDPNQHNGEWPTLAWMQNHNKRIVIFDEDKTSSTLDVEGTAKAKNYLFRYTWHDVIESQYGTLNKEDVCKQRPGSQLFNYLNRPLYLLNFFRTLSGPWASSAEDNSYETLKGVIQFCYKEAPNIKTPNFIALDFVEQGNGMKLVNELNHHTECVLHIPPTAPCVGENQSWTSLLPARHAVTTILSS
jgi:hypothetical protein